MPHFTGFDKLTKKLNSRMLESDGDYDTDKEKKKKKFRLLIAAKKKGKYYDEGGDAAGSYGG